jgi:hypothetical protein
LQHLQVAVGIAEGCDRAAADVFVDADRLAWPIGSYYNVVTPQYGARWQRRTQVAVIL